MKSWPYRQRWLLVLFALLILVTVALTGTLMMPWPALKIPQSVRPSILILDRNGQRLYEIATSDSRQTPLAFEQIPDACWQATIAIEDKRFFLHPGFDPLAIARAAWQNARSGYVVSGASTLTQQLARNTLMSADERYDQSYWRKLREAWLAWRIERQYSKEDILALYLNQVYFGNFATGLEAAAYAYYGKSSRDLDLAECSLLVGLVQNPTLHNPLLDLESAKARQGTVLQQMADHGYITATEADLASRERLQFAAGDDDIEAAHFVSFTERQLGLLLGNERLQQGGLQVITTLDLNWQRQAERIVRRQIRLLAEEEDTPAGRRLENAALLALDPSSGAILSMVGSPDYFDATISGAVNGAVALRQPGSAMKPITYAVALDPTQTLPPLTAASVIADVRTSFLTAEGEPYAPQNYDLRWHGPVSVRTALASSYNMPAVKTLENIGVPALIEQARKQGITSFRADTRYGLALTLGGGEVSLLQLTGAYAAFANGGFRIEPHAILRLEDEAGHVLFDAETSAYQQRRPRVLDERVAHLITDILGDDDARAPSFGRDSVLRLARPAAVKTGTTGDWRDNWTVGYTPDLVAGVWVGNADNAPMIGVSGVSGAGPIWHDFMEMAHREQPVRAFSQPQGLVRTTICVDSGYLPTEWCTRRRSELFIAGTEPIQFDDVYQPFAIDRCADTLAGPQTSSQCLEHRVYRVYRLYPPELQSWAAANGVGQPPGTVSQPAHVAARPSTTNEPVLHLISPDPNNTYTLSPDLPPDLQTIRLAARPAGDWQPETVQFFVDGLLSGTTHVQPHEIWWQLAAGLHQIQAIGADAAGARIKSEIRWITVREG
ncbi:MAG: penicillin-binding protein [Chloroflexi bacterium]|nr:penicillin-binding protein [Chloroflexota bacterium]